MISCSALAAALAAASAGQVLDLAPGQTCDRVVVRGAPARQGQATLKLNGSTLRGIAFLRGAGQLAIEGPGVIQARDGWNGSGPAHYAVQLDNAHSVVLRGLTIRDAANGVAIGGGSSSVLIERVRFDGTMMDGISIGGGAGITVRDSVFRLRKTPDDRHGDAVQWWGDSDTITVADNQMHLRGGMQGVGGLGPRKKGILVRIERNRIDLDTYRAISAASERGFVRHNTVGDGDSSKKANIVVGPDVVACGNASVDGNSGNWAKPCPK